jgi:hypothetical protein
MTKQENGQADGNGAVQELSFGEFVRRRRLELELTQEELG